MNPVETFLTWSTLSFEVVLCGLVFARKTQRTLPLFSSYACASLALTTCVLYIQLHFGFLSAPSFYSTWASTGIFVVARSLAIAELCSYELENYRGIWALVWRALAALSVLLIVEAAMNAWGQPHGFAIYWASFARNFALASLVVLAALFLFRNYYNVPLEGLPKLIAIGLFFICAADAIGSAMLLSLFKGYLFPWFVESQKALWPAMQPVIRGIDDIWSGVRLTSFMAAAGIWCYALRKPVPVACKNPVLLPAEVYREISPAINMRLAMFNERLTELLKP